MYVMKCLALVETSAVCCFICICHSTFSEGKVKGTHLAFILQVAETDVGPTGSGFISLLWTGLCQRYMYQRYMYHDHKVTSFYPVELRDCE